MPEISEQDLAIYKKAHSTLDGLYNDKETGFEFKKLLKKKNPELTIPELDIAEQVRKPLEEKLTKAEEDRAAMAARLDAWEAAQKNRDEDSKLRDELAGVRKKYSLTDEGMSKVVERMKEKGNMDAESVAAWVVGQEPKPAPTKNSGLFPEQNNFLGLSSKDEGFKELHDNPGKWRDNQIEKILSGEIDISQDAY